MATASPAVLPPPPLPPLGSHWCLHCTIPTGSAPLTTQARELRLRDAERVTRCGAELLSRHARKLDSDERELGLLPGALSALPWIADLSHVQSCKQPVKQDLPAWQPCHAMPCPCPLLRCPALAVLHVTK